MPAELPRRSAIGAQDAGAASSRPRSWVTSKVGRGVENLKKAKAASLPLPFVAALPLAALLAEPEPGQEGAAFPEDMRPRHCPVALL